MKKKDIRHVLIKTTVWFFKQYYRQTSYFTIY